MRTELGVWTLPDGVPDLTLGWEAQRWAFKYLKIPKGPHAGDRWTYLDSQLRFLLWWYAVDADGKWLYRHAVRRWSKGAGKSPFAATVALLELCGPVRLHDFDPDRPGGVVGKPVDMPIVQIAATSESQTAHTMRMVRAMAPKGSRVVRDHGLDPGKQRIYKASDGVLEIITSSPTSAEGGTPTFLVADETEHWKAGNGGHALSEVLDRNLRKSAGSRMMETSNAFAPGEDSVAERTFNAWRDEVEGRTRGSAKTLYDASVPDPKDLAFADGPFDDAKLRRAISAAYRDAYFVDQDEIREAILDVRTPLSVSLRFYLNTPSVADDAWTTPAKWAAGHDPDRVVADGEDVVLFFDGSKSGDSTALVGCAVSDGFVFEVGVWEPDPHDTASVVDARAVDVRLRNAFERWNVRAFFADVKEFEGFVLESWARDFGDELAIWAAPNQKPPAPVAFDMRSRTVDFARAAEVARAEIHDGTLVHDGSHVLARHVANARAAETRHGLISVAKESPKSPNKIDGCVCVIGARMVRRMLLGSKQYQRLRPGGPTETAVFFAG